MNTFGNIKTISCNQACVNIICENGSVEMTFWQEHILQVKMGSTIDFSDETEGKILACTYEAFKHMHGYPQVILEEDHEMYRIRTGQVVIRIFKAPFKIEAYKSDEKTVIFREEEPTRYSDSEIIQTFEGDVGEYFYGGGVQNGYFSHKNKTIPIELKISHWNAGSVSSPAPFYMSTKGYGQFRNTFNKGSYAFKGSTIITHEEPTMDTFFFFAKDLQGVLDAYTTITGKAPIIPRWGLMPGDANCYKETMDALKVAKQYQEHQMPQGWMLPNDGYGCGYTDLKGFIEKAENIGFKVGLWTENSMDKIAQEVSEFGSRVVKTDVAWVGPGYAFGLDGVKVCYEGIEKNSKDRGYVWTCCGWAGTQRYSTVWSGDQFGNWEYIRMHIPTYIGAGLSGHPYCGSDVDGIFAGSAETQVRDLQWKCFTPILINMSGWAPKDKQPWVWGEPYTTYNRQYLQLKLRLTPYMYTYAYKAYKEATPIMRPMLWDYKEETYTLTKDTQYQFMLGDYLLVAPIYEDTNTRDGIYLPDKHQVWIDYFNGKQYQGGRVINSFEAPLDKLPVFVKNGAIIPMYPLGAYDGEKLPNTDEPLTFDIYPYGQSTFELYEDDGHTQAYKEGAYALTTIEVDAPKGEMGDVTIKVQPLKGSYEGMSAERCYEFMIHSKVCPTLVSHYMNEQGEAWSIVESKSAYDAVKHNVLYFDSNQAGGIVYIKTRVYKVEEPVAILVQGIMNREMPQPKVHECLPAIPKGLTGIEVKDTTILLGWESVVNAVTYDLKINGTLFENVTLPYLHRELEIQAEYSYQVRALNSCGGSEWSEQVSITTLECHLKNVLTSEHMEVEATSERPGYDAIKAVNGDDNSMWLSRSEGESDLPATYEMHFNEAYKICQLEYQSRPKGTRGNITKYNLAISQDGKHYKTVVTEGVLPDQDQPHFIDLKGEVVAKHIRIEALEGKSDYANAIHFRPYKVEGTDQIVIGDYTGGGTADENDLMFVKNYIGVAKGDNDWEYVSKCDVNYNDRIDVYDLAIVATSIDESTTEGIGDIQGKITLVPNVDHVQAGEVFEVKLVGEGMQNVYAFEAIFTLDTNKFAHQNCLGRRCKKEVIASSTALSEQMINASALKVDEQTRIVVAFCNQKSSSLIQEDGALATFTLLAKQTGKVDLGPVTTLLVGRGLDVIEG